MKNFLKVVRFGSASLFFLFFFGLAPHEFLVSSSVDYVSEFTGFAARFADAVRAVGYCGAVDELFTWIKDKLFCCTVDTQEFTYVSRANIAFWPQIVRHSREF